MKKLVLATLLAAAFGVAQAQSVTVYGVVDAGVRYDGSANAADADRTKFLSGVQSTSRFGLKGSEDLGGGLTAKFNVENGFSLADGTGSQNGSTGSVLFDRLAWIGVSSTTLGEVQLGRNTNSPFDFAVQGITDPLNQALDGVSTPVTVASSTALRVNQALTVVGATNSFKSTRSDGQIKYTNAFGPVTAVVGYAPGGVAGDSEQKTSWNAGVKATVVGVTGAASTFQAKDAAGKELKLYSYGATAPVGPVKLTAGYHKVTTDAGYAPANLTTTATAATVLGGVAGTTVKVATVGAKYQVSPKLSTTLAYYNGKYENATQNGKLDTYVLFNQYDLSKRTNLYLELDQSRAKGDLVTTAVSSTNVGVTAGVRHSF